MERTWTWLMAKGNSELDTTETERRLQALHGQRGGAQTHLRRSAGQSHMQGWPEKLLSPVASEKQEKGMEAAAGRRKVPTVGV